MKGNITITNLANQTAEIAIEGIIGLYNPDSPDIAKKSCSTYSEFKQQLDKIQTQNITSLIVHIRSTGGDVNDALLIHDALRSLHCPIITRCYGYTASAATIIAQAASPGKREMSANGLYLIHRASCNSEGNATTLDETAQMLLKTDERIANIYAKRSGLHISHFIELMEYNQGNGRWLSPEETLKAGLIDRIFTAQPITNHASFRTLCETLAELPLNFNSNPTTMTLKQHWHAMLDLLGLATSETSDAVTPAPTSNETPINTVPQTVGSEPAQTSLHHTPITVQNYQQEIASLKAQIASLEAENARLQAYPTRTLPREDPSPIEKKISANAHSYNEDIRNFK